MTAMVPKRFRFSFEKGTLKMALTKKDIVFSIYTNLALPKYKTEEIVESLLEIIKRTIANGEDVLISRFGKFSVKEVLVQG